MDKGIHEYITLAFSMQNESKKPQATFGPPPVNEYQKLSPYAKGRSIDTRTGSALETFRNYCTISVLFGTGSQSFKLSGIFENLRFKHHAQSRTTVLGGHAVMYMVLEAINVVTDPSSADSLLKKSGSQYRTVASRIASPPTPINQLFVTKDPHIHWKLWGIPVTLLEFVLTNAK